jgi:hypothetical protein
MNHIKSILGWSLILAAFAVCVPAAWAGGPHKRVSMPTPDGAPCNQHLGNNCSFIVPSDGYVYLHQASGTGAGVTTFGMGTSPDDFVPYYTGLPGNPNPTGEVLVGYFTAGKVLHLGMHTTFNGGAGWAFSVSNDLASVEAFTDIHDSLDMGGSIIEQTGEGRWLLHLDDALSYLYGDNNNDVLMRIRISPNLSNEGICLRQWGNNCPFVMPSDGNLYLQQMGGEAGADTTFGIGTSPSDFVPYYTGLPNNPNPTGEVLVGFFPAGTTIHFGMYTTFGGDAGWAFSVQNDLASVEAFTDIGDRLGMGGGVIEQTGEHTWLMHLDDALSYQYGDDNNDVLMQLRVAPAQ